MCRCVQMPSVAWPEIGWGGVQVQIRWRWQPIADVGRGWAELWRCPSCGRLWDFVKAQEEPGGKVGCMRRVYRPEHSWIEEVEEKYTRFVEEQRLLNKVDQLHDQYAAAGFDVLRRFGLFDWELTKPWYCRMFCTKKRFLSTTEMRIEFVLLYSGEVSADTERL